MTPATATMPAAALPFLSRLERFERVESTNDVVRAWLAAGVAEVPVAVADEQTAGRGRSGRTWFAPPGAALLVSAGFRPGWLAPDRTWRLAAIAALAMADAAEDVAGLATATIRLKWPNDLVVVVAGPGAPAGLAERPAPKAVSTEAVSTETGATEAGGTDSPATETGAAEALARQAGPLEIRKLAGILGETEEIGTADPRAVIGIGINADWPAEAFPAELATSMTSLREVSGGRPIDRDALLDGFLARLETRLDALRGGRFDVAGWGARQVTTGRIVRLEGPGGTSEVLRATGVDGASGALLVEPAMGGGPIRDRAILAGEVTHLRLAPAEAV